MSTSTGRFEGKVAIVTGAASGIGQAIARRLHAEGASVLGGDLNIEGLDALQTELSERFLPRAGDVTVLKRLDQAGFVMNWPAASVDEDSGLFHQTELT